MRDEGNIVVIIDRGPVRKAHQHCAAGPDLARSDNKAQFARANEKNSTRSGHDSARVLLFASYEGGYIVYHGASGIEPKLLAPELREKQEKKQGRSGEQSRSAEQRASAPAPR